MKRYSLLWWAIILPTSVVVGVPTFFLVGHLTDWAVLQRVALALIATLSADLIIAASMEAIAPTKVKIGPGERQLQSDAPAEKAIVIGGFGASLQGQVSVRGETWVATRLPDETTEMSAGMVVRVVDRYGLSLVVTPDRD
jgi:membrane protein implicated in regulation of membrane protease activity